MEYNEKLLNQWEEVYKKGQLTFWILVSISQQPAYIEEIKQFIDTQAHSSMTSQDQSLYRALRKFVETGIVQYQEVPGNRGPNRKQYGVTPMGKQLLVAFTKRNIQPLNHPIIKQLLKEGA
jgi:PadR family transcriptional regulator PadR